MTEKVVSLSGGLVLGMAFALFLSVSTTQTMNQALDFDYPSMSSLIGVNDLQSYRSSSPVHSTDTTPAINVAPPAQQEDRGRIIRIATVTETTDPLDDASTTIAAATAAVLIPKTTSIASQVDRRSTLQQMHRQHSYIAGSSSPAYTSVGQIASQSGNFTAIADNGQGVGQAGGQGGTPPSVIDNKPQTSGTPSVAQNDPGSGENEGEESGPAIAGFNPGPREPESSSNGSRHHVDPYNPQWNNNFHETEDSHGGHGPDPHGADQVQQGHRPEVD
jgi:hypothetical protein